MHHLALHDKLTQLEVVPCKILHDDVGGGDASLRAQLTERLGQLPLAFKDPNVRRLSCETELCDATPHL